MNITSFCRNDIAPFLRLAAGEKWVVDSWEIEFLLTTFPRGCFAARDDNEETAGFVTSLRHERSGWVGNLIVAAKHRGRKIGERLFTTACEALRADGVETVWLTASKAGQPLYEKHGFSSIDTVIRWVGSGGHRHVQGLHRESRRPHLSVSSIDCQAWGDRRDALLAATAARGELLLDESGFVVVQPSAEDRQFGPFSAPDIGIAERLFDAAMNTVAPGTAIMVDAPAANRSAFRLYNRRNMRIVGSTELMYAGRKPAYRPELIYGLATMGSCG